MPKKLKPISPIEIPSPDKNREYDPDYIPEIPVLPVEEPDLIPDEDPFETPPYELPEPGEGP